jgi:hypothetical protein
MSANASFRVPTGVSVHSELRDLRCIVYPAERLGSVFILLSAASSVDFEVVRSELIEPADMFEDRFWKVVALSYALRLLAASGKQTYPLELLHGALDRAECLQVAATGRMLCAAYFGE